MSTDPYLAASHALLYVAALGVLVMTFLGMRNSRRARLAAAKAAHPSNRAHQPQPARQTCAVTGCAYPAFWIVTRRGFNTTERVCTGCYHEGDAWGWWK